ncbi:S26 family signal peptidase [Clostridium butyricum]|nr:S26 family signal peptidase [Clostridium butyricum]
MSNELAFIKIKNWLMLNKKQMIMYIAVYIVAQIVVIALMCSMFSFSEIISGSMRNTLQIGDTIFIDKLTYINKEP